MTKTITPDDVLRYIYKETTTEENKAIENQLLLNGSITDFYNQVKDTVKMINDLQIEPPGEIQQNILEYSSSLNFESIS
jgi:hypothetical protein